MITGLPAASAGATLCATRFSGKLNGVMPATGPERHTPDVCLASVETRQPIERNDLAVDALGFLGRDLEGEDGAIDLRAAPS